MTTTPPEPLPSPAVPAVDVSATEPDWVREGFRRDKWEPQKHLIRSIRRHQHWKRRGGLLGKLMAKYWALKHRVWSVVTASEIPPTTEIGGGLVLPHPTGVVIHVRSRIGPNCMIFQGVTLGEGGKGPGAPTIGGHVDIGAGAKLLGPIRVGDHAKIGANAVVLIDVPPGRTAVGIPARII